MRQTHRQFIASVRSKFPSVIVRICEDENGKYLGFWSRDNFNGKPILASIRNDCDRMTWNSVSPSYIINELKNLRKSA